MIETNKEVNAVETEEERLKKIAATASRFEAAQLGQLFVPPKDKGEMDEPVKVMPELCVTVETHPLISRTDESLKGFDVLPIIDSIEKPILEGVKKVGFTCVNKTDTTRRFVKDEQTYFDVEKNGVMHSKNYAIDGDEKNTIDGIVNSTLAMIEIYLQVAQKHGNDLAFPSGAINIKTEISPGAVTPENKEKVDHLTSMIEIKVTDALRGKKYDGIRSRILYEEKVVREDSQRTRMLKEAYPPTNDINKRQVLDRSMVKEALYSPRMGKST